MADQEASEASFENDITASQRMLSAVSGSLLTSLLVTPLDVVRVRAQSQIFSTVPNPRPQPLPTGTASSFSNLPPNLGVTACCREVFWVNNNAQFCIASPISHTSTTSSAACAIDSSASQARASSPSILSSLRQIARTDGLTSLWRGLSPTLLMSIPGNVIYFSGYDVLRSNPSSPVRNYVSEQYAPLVAGSIARITAAAVVSPIEMFRTRLQATSGAARSGIFMQTLVGLKEMVQAQGVTSLWRGLQLTMWRDVPFSAIYWWGYEASRNSLTDLRERSKKNRTTLEVDQDSFANVTSMTTAERSRARSQSRGMENHSATFVDSFIAGAVSGGVASMVTTPFDVGKTRQQVFKHSEDAITTKSAMGKEAAVRVPREVAAAAPENQSMPKFLYHIFKTEGIPGLFKGGLVRCLKVAPACAIMISSYEVGKKMAKRVNEKKRADNAALG
ncbi:hypothetical protein MMC25_003000 [Agyrium rufum]|nr:hypothetical protein [Agyrium rufum]